jgi:hypothetical protein
LKFLYSEEASLSFRLGQDHVATASLLLPLMGTGPDSHREEALALSRAD